MKRKILFLGLILSLSLAGCKKADEVPITSTEAEISADETKEGTSESASNGDTKNDTSFTTELELNSKAVTSTQKEENPFAMYDGYYSGADANSFELTVFIKDGIITIETRGESIDGTQTEMYVEDNKAYAEFDGKKIQLGKRTQYDLEYVVVGDPLPSYLSAIPDEYVDLFVERIELIKKNEQANYEAAKAELEAAKKLQEETAASLAKEAEEKEKAEAEEKKKAEEKEAKLSEKRNSPGWIKGKYLYLVSGGSEHDISIEIVDSKDFGAGSIISIYCVEYDSCVNNFGPLLCMNEGQEFEAIIKPHECGGPGYRIIEFLN